jgi:hypothetical protein
MYEERRRAARGFIDLSLSSGPTGGGLRRLTVMRLETACPGYPRSVPTLSGTSRLAQASAGELMRRVHANDVEAFGAL